MINGFPQVFALCVASGSTPVLYFALAVFSYSLIACLNWSSVVMSSSPSPFVGCDTDSAMESSAATIGSSGIGPLGSLMHLSVILFSATFCLAEIPLSSRVWRPRHFRPVADPRPAMMLGGCQLNSKPCLIQSRRSDKPDSNCSLEVP
ncbi:hypothetical protein F5Y17DRAFT_341112 [Xylariaceae sp. FL0594]|nr:hypothetical protein F5Y17DRAFT_341112 [Xylariaceae sp. FL0594]